MNTSESVLKDISKIALAGLAVLFVGAFVFYKERLFFGDASFIVFNIINDHHLQIQEHRYGSFVTQMVPYLLAQMHLPLKTVLMGYAVSFNLFYLLVGFILYRCRQYSLVILAACYYFLFVSHSYFWTNNEIHQAVAWMFLMFGITTYMGKRKVNVFITAIAFALLAFLTVFTHFVVLIPLFFLWIYFVLEKVSWPFSAKVNVAFGAILIIIAFFKYRVTQEHSYDGDRLHGITHFSIKDVFYAVKTPVVKFFFRRCLTNYWVVLGILFAGVYTLVKEKRFSLAVWTIAAVVGYIVIMGLTYGGYDGSFSLFHIESEWESMGIIVASPFVFSYLPGLQLRYAAVLVSTIFLVRLAYMCAAIPVFKWRTEFKQEVLAGMRRKGINKLGLYNDNPLMEKNILYWAMPEESMMMSALDGDRPQLTFVFINKDNKDLANTLSTDPRALGMSFNVLGPPILNHEYFNTDTLHTYQIMSYEDFLK